MTSPRLLALRLHGFKSFAERTVVEFGPGISAVVGPNGSGKSNLADALRWTLGEQGRALRSRKSEDVIFAGSDRRQAVGMADVTLVLDNADGLLPVDFQVLELGRRLYRSGENDYLLNRQRVRLKDLVDLLDAAHLADNAFLFIGQGMVDQALALRPEERRPLFEEVAGVRRHERRRRRAEEQLVEAEANLARVEDILGELRPQARRLAAQAQQQATRETAGEELAAALAVLGHVRWHEASTTAGEAAARLSRARAELDRSLAALTQAEAAMSAVRASLAERSSAERTARSNLEAARARFTAVRIESARIASDAAGLDRDADRLATEREAATADLETRRRALTTPVPEPDHGLERTLADADRGLADALDELTGLRAARDAQGESLRAARRAEAARVAEHETAQRRLAESRTRLHDERVAAAAADGQSAELARRLEAVRREVAAAAAVEAEAAARREPLRAAADGADAAARQANEHSSSIAGRVATVRGQVDALAARRAEDESRGLAKRARRSGGHRVDDGVVVDPAFRAAVEAALGEASQAYVVDPDVLPGLTGERGVAIAGPTGAPTAGGSAARTRSETADASLVERIADAGGGLLPDVIRSDPAGAVRRLLARAAWLPDLAGVLAIQPFLPPGWTVVNRDGSVAAGPVAIRFGKPAGALERAAEEERLAAQLASFEREQAAAVEAATAAAQAAAQTRAAVAEAAGVERTAAESRRRWEDQERSIGRSAEAGAREAAWHAAQVERLAAESARLDEAVRMLAAQAGETASPPPPTGDASADDAAVIEAWGRRVADLRERRDRIAADLAASERTRRDAEAAHAAAAAAAAIDEERLARAEREGDLLAERRRATVAAAATAAAELASAEGAVTAQQAAVDALAASDDDDRARLATAEALAAELRERLRATEDRSRAAESADLQARLELDLVREQVLVELAGLGEVGLRALQPGNATTADGAVGIGVFGTDGRTDDGTDDVTDDGTLPDDNVEGARFEAALSVAIERWRAAPPIAQAPSGARVAALRRRFHELGAANPFAATEYAELRDRLETMETQERDLRDAITATRSLIAELSTLVSEQFRMTFRALEGAFDARFRQLFGGGYAKLSLTDPEDLTSTGVEIVARPPGKKAQALAMLSGGERALTAVALLFAMLEVRPVPFCVLDEVDAALDEANIGRFTDALRSLATTTQFVVITHNRGTIEAADALYGITVGEDSVSRVISLRVDEASALAARGRGEPHDRELAAAG